MSRWWPLAAVTVLTLAAGPASTADDQHKTRNPFKVKDVPDSDGRDVKAFAAKVKLPA